jgi:hypothetical protein
VSRGYGNLEDVIGLFTIDQVEHFVRVSERRRRRELFDLALAVRVGFGADKHTWKEYSDFLLKEPGESVVPSSKEQMRALKDWSRKKAKRKS